MKHIRWTSTRASKAGAAAVRKPADVCGRADRASASSRRPERPGWASCLLWRSPGAGAMAGSARPALSGPSPHRQPDGAWSSCSAVAYLARKCSGPICLLSLIGHRSCSLRPAEELGPPAPHAGRWPATERSAMRRPGRHRLCSLRPSPDQEGSESITPRAPRSETSPPDHRFRRRYYQRDLLTPLPVRPLYKRLAPSAEEEQIDSSASTSCSRIAHHGGPAGMGQPGNSCHENPP